MKKLRSRGEVFWNALLSSALTALFVTATVSAATTISTNIDTGGTLNVSGASTLNSSVTLGDAGADVITITGNASTTNSFEVGNFFYVNGFATTTGSNGNFATLGTIVGSSTAQFTGAVTTYGNVTLGDAGADVITITGNASTTNSFEVGNDLYVNGFATTTGSNGNFNTLGTLTVSGISSLANASSTHQSLTGNLMVGGRATTTASSGNFDTLGSVTVGGTLTVTGTFSPSIASSTLLSVTNTAYFGGTATSTFNSAGSLNVVGNTTLGDAGADVVTITGNASTTNSFEVGNDLYVNGFATTTGSNGNFATFGTIYASSTSLFTGAVTTYGNVTLGDAGADVITITGNASTTNSFEVGNDLYVNGFATTTGSNGNFNTLGTLTVSGISSLANASSTHQSLTGNLMVGGRATTTASSGNIETEGSLTVGTGNTAHSGFISGVCNIVGAGTRSVTATSTAGVACTGATGITTDYKVFVSATSTLTTVATGGGFTIQGASSTASATIGVQLINIVGADATPAGTINFWAVK